MSQRRKTQKSLSQPSTSSGITHDSDEEDHAPRSQQTQRHNKTFNAQEHAQHVSNAVRYILSADQSKHPITKAAVSKAIDCTGGGFRGVMNTVEQVLEDVFGYKVVNIKNNETSSGKFILCNKIGNSLPHMTFDKQIGDQYVLLFLILSHIYMNGETCTEASLSRFLTKAGILEENNMNHELYGNVLNLITVDFVKQRYIKIETTDNSDNPVREFTWGERALNELSARNVMEFTSMIYGGRELQSWPQQYERMKTLEREGLNPQENGNIEE